MRARSCRKVSRKLNKEGIKGMIEGVSTTEGRITVFYLKTDLTADRVKDFLKKMDELLQEGRNYLVLDLSEVTETSLLAMVGLSSLFNKCRLAGGTLKVAGLTPRVRKAFRMTNLINTLEVFETTLDAVKSFRSHNLLKSKMYSGSFYLKDRNAFVGWERLPQNGYLH